MLIGYARVSTEDQKLRLQWDALKQVGCEKEPPFLEEVDLVTFNRHEESFSHSLMVFQDQSYALFGSGDHAVGEMPDCPSEPNVIRAYPVKQGSPCYRGYSAKGELSIEQYDELQKLFTDELNTLYEEDSRHTDKPYYEIEPTSDRPVYIIFYADETREYSLGGEYVDDEIEHDETRFMISSLSDLLDTLLVENNIQMEELLAEP